MEYVPDWRSLGIDLGGASSRTTGYAVVDGDTRPRLVAAGLPLSSSSPQEAEARLLALVDDWTPQVVAIDAPLTLPPCLTCPAYCRGPGAACELQAARSMWSAGRNPVSQRPCEIHVELQVGERPLPTMQIGVITARAVAFARGLANRGLSPSVMQRGEVLEVYPRATLRRLGDGDARLLPRSKGEAAEAFRSRVLGALSEVMDGIDEHPSVLENGHVFDALIAAYTGWLGSNGLEAPPDGFNLASGWIWVPRRSQPTSA